MEKTMRYRGQVAITLALCFAIAIFEGFDLQSMGVAAPRMRAEFGLNNAQMAWAFSAATLGTLPGALLGGRFADKIGRKSVLIFSILLFGIMSVLTAFASDYSLLLLIRFLTGLGMGGALPMMITLASEAVSEQYKGTAVSVMYSGIPFGGMLTSFVAMALAGDSEWRHIFYIGGLAPIFLIPLLMKMLPESNAYINKSNKTTVPYFEVLFAKERRFSTIQIWVSFFCTLVVLYFLLNWLPLLMGAQGLSKVEANYVQIGYNVGGIIGSIMMGVMLDRLRMSFVVKLIYAGILFSLCCLAISPSVGLLALSAVGCGVFIVGGQSALYGLAAMFYPTEMRGTGVGAAVAIGRLGSFAGPLLAGLLLSFGSSSTMVIGSSIPMILIAAISALLLVRRKAKPQTQMLESSV
ncbi:3-(3-hydroxy-phenyl)propionate transporter MhpT [Acinetobacter gerneri]|jgi:AAHS family 3-hydroxyphenylpropionic acid transporter|uniref:3-(3-hydroxy-phenyl)propionate transporter MhpT n=1 Tax=Acinetobacter gerneri TaxID=202952 RepID=A0AAW8JKM3_9GAMM|nr:3-(3-hydroxy-phenyl)propionate transporter MhpT [Acinetobacter gerneri]MCH4244249.1 3-(3-hydroxy-phenyl)propionate transporter MhpT [Acinetobacter gerneri]MDQ9010249.1 3-(3-hydroxy-phenyl)propionate transporter MhpT [Acinetobacter gerneri]MDQ9014338.1 3-(3-hydroxy-phenyl)propionate transporter MhpT [Acinetobacter gerneri]MDQ9025509.1 3-(3-hydroxy-phenyl)propionate transporter MhpT [Acinetobacter gerneri]MDQ9052808.1 3-(3-hydroxy-phenyl)propionate transporter MhpT [Acinetobacter gerneri]